MGKGDISIFRYCVAYLSLCGLFFIGGCAPVITAYGVKSEVPKELVSVKNIIILPFDGNRWRQDFTRRFEQYVGGIMFSGKQHFNIIERERFEEIMREMKLGASGILGNAYQLGKIANADAFFTGSLEHWEVNKKSVTVERWSSKTGRWRTLICTKYSSSLKFILKVIVVESAKIAYTNDYDGESGSYTRCQGESAPLYSDLYDESFMNAMKKVRINLAPYHLSYKVKFMEEETNMNHASEEILDRGIDFLEAGRTERACRIFQEGYEVDRESMEFNYNLGACQEVRGNLREALVFYLKADNLTRTPVSMINKAILRVRSRIIESKNVNKQ